MFELSEENLPLLIWQIFALTVSFLLLVLLFLSRGATVPPNLWAYLLAAFGGAFVVDGAVRQSSKKLEGAKRGLVVGSVSLVVGVFYGLATVRESITRFADFVYGYLSRASQAFLNLSLERQSFMLLLMLIGVQVLVIVVTYWAVVERRR